MDGERAASVSWQLGEPASARPQPGEPTRCPAQGHRRGRAACPGSGADRPGHLSGAGPVRQQPTPGAGTGGTGFARALIARLRPAPPRAAGPLLVRWVGADRAWPKRADASALVRVSTARHHTDDCMRPGMNRVQPPSGQRTEVSRTTRTSSERMSESSSLRLTGVSSPWTRTGGSGAAGRARPPPATAAGGGTGPRGPRVPCRARARCGRRPCLPAPRTARQRPPAHRWSPRRSR